MVPTTTAKKSLALPMLALVTVGFLQLPGAFHGTERHLDTLLRLPNHPTTNDVGDILEQYKDYLNFVVEAGRATNPGVAKKLEEKYAALEKADRTLAARFLRGLRFEILQKVELTGMAPGSVTTALPGVRRWVDRFLAVWLREADEYLFRAKAGRIARAKED